MSLIKFVVKDETDVQTYVELCGKVETLYWYADCQIPVLANRLRNLHYYGTRELTMRAPFHNLITLNAPNLKEMPVLCESLQYVSLDAVENVFNLHEGIKLLSCNAAKSIEGLIPKSLTVLYANNVVEVPELPNSIEILSILNAKYITNWPGNLRVVHNCTLLNSSNLPIPDGVLKIFTSGK